MTKLKDITTMCKAGETAQAYELAKADVEASPDDVWAQRGLGWALYYLLKADAAAGDVPAFTAHLEELMGLDALDAGDDAMLFDNVLWPLAGLIRQMAREGHPDGLQHLLGLLEGREFQPSKGYSCLLRVCIAFKQWDGLAAFIEWWGLDNLLPEDYLPFKKDKVSIMSLAEQASIAYAKALLAKGDKDKMAAFLPRLERLADEHPEMTYPGYFCGKLMLSMGTARDEALRMVMPLVRRKRAEFWVWQLLAEVYEGEPDTQLACCLRAVHCKTKEDFLGKVRLKLAALYVARGDHGRAVHHLNAFAQCYKQNGWHVPAKAMELYEAHKAELDKAAPDASDGIDYRRMTDRLLFTGLNESVAFVSYVAKEQRYAIIIYGEKRRAKVRLSDLRVRVNDGQLLMLHWEADAAGAGINVAGAELLDASALGDTPYLKRIVGRVSKQDKNPFAFVRAGEMTCFVSPQLVSRHGLQGGETVAAIAVLNWNKKKDEWAWSCALLEVVG